MRDSTPIQDMKEWDHGKTLIETSKCLWHAPQELGLELHPGGWMTVDDLLVVTRKHGFPTRVLCPQSRITFL